jgi:hypothetical protein
MVAVTPARSSSILVSVWKPARAKRIPRCDRSRASASRVSAPLLSTVVTVLPSMTTCFKSGWAVGERYFHYEPIADVKDRAESASDLRPGLVSHGSPARVGASDAPPPRNEHLPP